MKITLSNILYVLISLYGALVLTPYVYTYCRIVILIVGIIWIFLAICYMWKRYANYNFLIVIMGFWSWSIVLKISGYSTAMWAYYGMNFLVVIAVCMYAFMVYEQDRRRWSRVGNFLYVTLFLNLLDNIYLYTKYKDLAEYRTSDSYIEIYGKTNAGATNFAFLIMIMGIVALIYAIWDKRGHVKTAMSTVYILSIYFVGIHMGRGIATVLFVFGTVLIIGYRFYGKVDLKSRKWLFAYGCIVIAVFVAFKVQFLDFLILIIGRASGRLTLKLINIRDLFTGKNQWTQIKGNSLSIRFYLILEDIKFFKDNILTIMIGNGLHKMPYTTDIYQALELNKAGGHSDIFDILAQYGSVGLCYLILFFKGIYIKGKQSIRNNFFWLCIMLLYILYGILGNCFSIDVVVATLLMTPGMLCIVRGVDNENQQYA